MPASESVVLLDFGPTTEPIVAGCRRGSTFHRTLQFVPEKDRFRCAEAAMMQLPNVDFCVFPSIREGPTYRASSSFQFNLNDEQRLFGER